MLLINKYKFCKSKEFGTKNPRLYKVQAGTFLIHIDIIAALALLQ